MKRCIQFGTEKIDLRRVFIKILNHIKTIFKHKKAVYIAMKQCGMPIRGLFHDLSKFSPTEFIESVKYYNGTESPINGAKKDKGYSMAWFHHRGRNPHHSQYWCDISFGKITPCEMPRRYLIELVCDTIGAGKTYLKEKWNSSSPIDYFNSVDCKSFYHDNTLKKLVEIYSRIKDIGWENTAKEIKNNIL